MFGVILAGGAGTRLWPKSRAYWPKFLLKFNKHSLLQECFLRLCSFIPPEKIFVISNVEHKFLVKENITDLKIKFFEANIIAEPLSRNTAAAIALAARYILTNFSDEPMLVCPSDHFIKDNRRFSKTVKDAVSYALEGKIVTFGVKPTRPETGYGYIKFSGLIRGKIYRVERFVEKPDLEKAKIYCKSKNYYWNTGIFLFRPSVILQEIKNLAPSLDTAISKIESFQLSEISAVYKKIDSISIDFAIMEKTRNIVGSRLDILWDDLGDWNSIERVYQVDKRNNIFLGRVFDLGSVNTTVVGDKRIIATVGLKDLVVVDTEDALLVCKKSDSQKLKEIVEKIAGYEEALYHKTSSRPWGHYTVLEKGKDYKVKIIHVLPHKKLSLQKHKRRSEHWLVVDGTAAIIKGTREFKVKKGQMVEIPVFTTHRLENKTNKTLKVVEISRGKYIGEDDIIRLEDDYRRI